MADLKGILIVKKDTEIISDSFKKRDFVIETLEQYPQKIPFQLVQDKTQLLDNKKIGEEINVSFNYRGKESTNQNGEAKFFLTLQAWKID